MSEVSNGKDLGLIDAASRERITTDTATTLFVEAGAGSGKTHALVQRICQLVLHDGVELDHIAAITFTEKAAAELRERVRVELSKHDTPAARTALMQVDTAALGTLHAFAARVVSEHPLEAGVPPRISVVDAMGSQLSFERRWRRMRSTLFSDEAKAPPGLAEAMQVVIGVGASLDQVRTLADALDRSWDRLQPNDSPPVVAEHEIDEILRAADEVAALRAECTDKSDKLIVQLDKVAVWRSEMAAGADSGAWLSLVDSCPGPGRGGKSACWGGKDRLAEIKDAIRELKVIAGEVRLAYAASGLAVVVHHLSHAVIAEARKRQRQGQLAFHDLLVHARDVLSDPEVQQAVHDRYRRILLDEFQDTDPLQLEIARRIVAGPDQTGRLFTVGDPKQSIYRFRRADIASYMAASDATAPSDVVQLTTNFRSTKPVLDWVNSVFSALVQSAHHIQPAYAPLDPAPGRPDWKDSPWGPHPFVFLNDAVPSEDEDALSESEMMRSREATDVARIIATATATERGWEKETSHDGEFSHSPVELSDICILIPSRAVLPHLERALDAGGVEFRSEASSLVYSTQEVHDLLVTARALSNTADEAALVAALRTPLFGCGDDDLLRWKSAGGRWSWFGDPPEGLRDSPVAEALNYLHDKYFELGRLTPGALLSLLATERRVFEVSMDSPRHRDVWRRLRFVFDQAHAWYGEDGGSLRDYLDWAQTQQEENARVAEAVLPEIGVNAVRIMTIHAAKGLQFPMVIVAGMSGGFRTSKEPVLWNDSGLPSAYLSAGVRGLEYDDLATVETQHTLAERVRLLYVACTRAESFLAVSGYLGRGQCWGRILEPALAGLPKTIPDLVDPVRDDDDHHDQGAEIDTWEQWEAETAGVHATSSLPSSLSVTDIVHEKRAEGTTILQGYRTADLLTLAVGEEKVPAAVGSTESGAALGTALHALLETGGQAVQLDETFDDKARAAAALAGLADADRFVLLARSALTSGPVRRAAEREHWQEMPLGGVAPGSDIVVEGIADLVYREDDGSLVIVDYKTDVGVSRETLEQYWAQLAIYADLLRGATGETVSSAVLIFCRPDEAVVLQRQLR
ncbi:ATP-dependent helicase/nuclease subunit A [Williamsia muralis]|uniref:DNA 3'-5' helicase n=1 Tax=Williamsia marianensis TaxID=85044 RepID=A0A495K5P2_WILMA|nr:ATP-dependent helicase/nuclease subunit A [Williamsia muralis]